MRFTVEVPLYLTMTVDAADAEDAAATAQTLADRAVDRDLMWGGIGKMASGEVTTARFQRLDEDGDPDVYVCRGGKLTAVEADGQLTLTGDDCD